MLLLAHCVAAMARRSPSQLAGDPAVPEGPAACRRRHVHKTKIKVVEDALDANNTIARANRDDFDRGGGDGREPDERPRRRQDVAARARRARPRRRARRRARGRRAGQPRRRPAREPARAGHADQHRPGLRRRVPPGREHGALGDPVAAARRDRPARDRERRQPRLPGRVPGRRGRAGDGRRRSPRARTSRSSTR